MSIVSRPGLRIREIKTSSGRTINHVIEVEDPGEVVIYDWKVKTVADLATLREALGRLAVHLGERRRAAA